MMNLFHKNFFAMNTRFEVVSYGKDAEIFSEIFDSIEKSIKQLEMIISCYNSESQTFRINHSQTIEFCQTSEDLFEIISVCEKYKHSTFGCFDYCLDNNFVYDSRNSTIGQNQIKVGLDKSNYLFRFTEKGLALDFGAIGKGIALKKVSEILEEYHISNCFISFGESSILTRGKHPHGPFWPFSIIDMNDKTKVHGNFQLNNHCVSTSATFQPDGKNHIIDPRKNKLVDQKNMISVKSGCPIEAEVLSTALLVAGNEEQKDVLKNFKNYEIIEINNDSKPTVRIING